MGAVTAGGEEFGAAGSHELVAPFHSQVSRR
jgi:hypothetical protein